MKLLLVGGSTGTQVAASLLRAASNLGLDVQLFDTNNLTASNPLWGRICWHLGDRKIPGMQAFNHAFIDYVSDIKPDVVITTGNSPLFKESLKHASQLGVNVLNFSTDDPFNRHHKSRWFLKALAEYKVIFTPRHANGNEFANFTQARVRYLPFAYDPETFFLDKNLVKQDKIVFVGTGDKDRFPLLHSISNLPVPLEIYGSYWEKEATLAPFSQGQAKPETIRVATTQSLISLCLVRRANRDGHVMRSFEIPPCGAAMLVEYTDEHAHIFGADGDCVRYFKKDSDLPHVAAEMLEDREQLPIYASKVMNKIISEGNTYQDRLQEMLLFA